MKNHRYYPSEICIECGNKHGRSRNVYAIGMWAGKCGWCGKEGTVTAPRDFRYPEFTGEPPEGWDKE
jgi:hypothetical protein